MAYNSFPYTSMHELNLDYLLNKSKEVDANVAASAGSASAAATSAASAANSAEASLTYSRNSANSAAAAEASAADSADSARIAVAAAGDPVTFTAATQLTDTSKIYVYVGETGTYTYGHYYYYQGGTWHDGGVYGTWATDDELSDSSTNAVQNRVITAKVSELNSEINTGVTPFKYTNGMYISSVDGSEVTQGASTFSASDFIPVYTGTLEIFSDAGNDGSYDAFYDSNKQYISSFEIRRGTNLYQMPNNAAYVRISMPTVSVDEVKIYTQLYRQLSDITRINRYVNESEIIDGYLLTKNGRAVASAPWECTDYMEVFPAGDMTLKTYVYGTGSLCFYNADKELLLGIDSTNASEYGIASRTSPQVVLITPPVGTKYIRMCCWKTYTRLTALYMLYKIDWQPLLETELVYQDDITNNYKYYKDKKVLVLGDSISTDSYGNYKKWVTDLIEEGKLSADNVTNSSQHASGFVARYNNQPNDFISRITAIPDKSTFDLVIVFGGINDFIQNIPLGGGEGETDIETYFKPAVDYFFSYLVNNFTQARLCVLSPLKNYNPYPNLAGNKQEVYSDYIKETAAKYCIPLLNLTDESGFCPFVESFKNMWTLVPEGYTAADGTHPTSEYEKKYLAPMIWKFISGLIA